MYTHLTYVTAIVTECKYSGSIPFVHNAVYRTGKSTFLPFLHDTQIIEEAPKATKGCAFSNASFIHT